MAKNRLVVPFLKWVGGKRQLIPTIKKRLPKGLSNCSYYEPFIGGGALLFELQPKRAIINDYNEELINVYIQKAEEPTKDEIVRIMKTSNLYNINSETTFRRRASTVLSWVNWILGIIEEEE